MRRVLKVDGLTEIVYDSSEVDVDLDTKSNLVSISLKQKHPPKLQREIIEYLNKCTNRKFNPKTASTVRAITARLNEGYSFKDFQRVIDIKVNEWGSDPKMAKFIRPETLFSLKFDSYLNQEVTTTPDEYLTKKMVTANDGKKYPLDQVDFIYDCYVPRGGNV